MKNIEIKTPIEKTRGESYKISTMGPGAFCVPALIIILRRTWNDNVFKNILQFVEF